jgi:hypothetical protein
MIPAFLPLAILLLLVGGPTWAAAVPTDPVLSDWLVFPIERNAEVAENADESEVVLENGLVRRRFVTAPDFATVAYDNLVTKASVLRGVKPEALISIDGTLYEIGGLKGQPDYGYLDPAWISQLTTNQNAFHFSGYEIGSPKPRYPWRPNRHSENAAWPPKGIQLRVDFDPPDSLSDRYRGLRVSVHYEMYSGLPTLSKWIEVTNGTDRSVTIDSVTSEVLAVSELEKDRLHVESDYSFAGMNTTYWGPDREYTTQVDYNLESPVLLQSRYPLGPGVELKPGETFRSFRTFELLFDSDDRERQGFARRRFYRTLSPQVTENPILMHVRQSDSESIRAAIDQCAEVGFEMVVVTFWSGFDIESEDPDYIARFEELADYAHSKGIELGGYTLMCASRNEGDEVNCIDPKTGKPGSKFGQSADLATEWGDGYFKRVLHFLDSTGMDAIETDGPYHGDVCASTSHKYHRGLEDSQLRQWERCVGFYHECRKRGIYINSPDWYYLNGSNKCAMGYRETNFSLPRWQQVVHSRQNIFDGTFDKTPSMGWMFVPLVEYQGGGAEATMEPLSEHLAEYEWHLAQNFGSGVQACYRGPRLYDTEETESLVKKWVSFYKKYRPLLDSDIIHVRRADGRDVDCMMHVNPGLPEKALAMVFNPAEEKVTTQLELPLYYTGITEKALVREQDGEPQEYELDRKYRIEVPIEIDAKSVTWFLVAPSGSSP